ncbi:hypothetical protein [Staphylococcus saccharolyticus]
MDSQLQQAIVFASKSKHTHIYMTATPPRHLLNAFSTKILLNFLCVFIGIHYLFQTLNTLN